MMGGLSEDLGPAAFTGVATALCGTAGGILPALLHTFGAATDPTSFAWLLSMNFLTVAAIGAGQGAVATATALARGRGRRYISSKHGVLGALAVGGFDALMYLMQMTIPATELGWTFDLVILGVAGAAAGWHAVRGSEGAAPVAV